MSYIMLTPCIVYILYMYNISTDDDKVIYVMNTLRSHLTRSTETIFFQISPDHTKRVKKKNASIIFMNFVTKTYITRDS